MFKETNQATQFNTFQNSEIEPKAKPVPNTAIESFKISGEVD